MRKQNKMRKLIKNKKFGRVIQLQDNFFSPGKINANCLVGTCFSLLYFWWFDSRCGCVIITELISSSFGVLAERSTWTEDVASMCAGRKKKLETKPTMWILEISNQHIFSIAKSSFAVNIKQHFITFYLTDFKIYKPKYLKCDSLGNVQFEVIN